VGFIGSGKHGKGIDAVSYAVRGAPVEKEIDGVFFKGQKQLGVELSSTSPSRFRQRGWKCQAFWRPDQAL
jgi:hypothetical protein